MNKLGSRSLPAVLALTQATFRQLVRDPALILVGGAGLLLIATAPVYAVFHFGELSKVMIDTGLSSALLAGLMVALLGPARTLAYELEDRTALALLSKPVGRLGVVVGKYLGVLGAVAAVLAPLVVAVLYVLRIAETGDLIEWSEGPELLAARRTLAKLWAVGGGVAVLGLAAGLLVRKARAAAAYLAVLAGALGGILLSGPEAWNWAVLLAGVLIFTEVAVVAAAATAAAVRLGTVGTLGVGLGVMVAGHLRELVGPGSLLGGASGIVLAPVPGLEAMNGLAAAGAGLGIPIMYVAWAGLYAALYATAALLVGGALFHGREVS